PNPLVTPYDTTIIDVPAGATVTAEFHHTLTSAGTSDGDEPISASHKGPIMVYLAKVPSALQTTMTGLQWFKIYEDGLHSDGTWAVDTMIANKGKVNFQMPVCVPSGEYFMRVELIALHAAGSLLGAQLYMECAQIRVTGGGSASPDTVSFPGAYTQSDPGILINKLSPAIQSLVQDPSHVARLRARPLSVFLALLLPVPLARPLHLQALVPLVQALVPLVRALALQVRAAHLALEALLFMDNAVDKGGQDLLPVHRVHAHTPVWFLSVMHLVSTYLPPTATSHAVKCNLGEDLLVVARINRLDVYKLLPNGLELSSSLELLSRVAALHEVSPDSGPGALLVITDHPDCTALIVEFSVKEQKLVVQSSHRLTSSIKRPLAGCTVCAVSADRRYAAVALYLGSMNIFSFGRKNGGIILEMKSESPISELLLSSFAFVPNPTSGEVTIALLYRTHSDEMKLSFKTIDEDTLDVSRDGHIVDMMKHAFQRLIPISSRGEGLLVIGDERIVYHGTQKKDRKQKSPIEGRRKSDLKQREAHILTEWQYSDITGYGVIDGERTLISDKYGKLVMIVIDKEKEGIQAHLLGEASSASCIAYINAGVIFLGSETGDSQLVQITSSGSLEVVDTYPNTAPIIDATLADIDNSGDPIVVTCSGEGKTGSLRIIRTGANIEELASIGDTKGVTRVFLLKDGTESDSYLLLSYPQETKIVNIKDSHTYSEVPENDFAGLVRDSTTLVAANLEVEYSHLAIQATRIAVNLINMQTGEQCNRWPGDIVAACIHGDMICVGLHDNSLLLLHVDQDRKLLKDGKQAQFGSQISVVSMRSDSTGKSNIFLGFWQKHVVQILNTDTLERMAEIEVPHVPLSIVPWEHDFPVVHRFHLLVGTGNGHVVTMRLRSKGSSFDIGERRLIYLGERPVHLQKYVDQGKENVIATGKRAVILSRSNRSVVQHHINIK
ncbi:hypothetical protein FRC18_003310, partial [Serendipita sp. 400]